VIIPLGTDRPLKRTPILTWTLGISIALAYVALAGVARLDPRQAAGITRALAVAGESPVWYTFLTYTYLHAGLMHLAGNLLILAIFGPNVEDRLGRIGFLALFLAGGAAAAGLHVVFERAGVIGASGAIAAITGAYIVLFPHTLVRIFYFFILIGVTQIPAWWFIAFAVAKDVVMTGLGMTGNVATLAHIGGYLLGMGVSAGLLASGVLKPEMYDLFSMAKRAKRRAEFRAAAELSQRRGEGVAPTTARAGRASAADELSAARMELARAVSVNDWARAEAAMVPVLERAGGPKAAASLTPKPQQELANALFALGRHAQAADAYETFLAAHATDAGALRVRLMLALTCARYLAQPARAKAVLAEVKSTPQTEDEKALLAQLRAEVGG